MPDRPSLPASRSVCVWPSLLALIAVVQCFSCPTATASKLRHTPIVKAVQQAAPSVVNIHGQKLVDQDGLPAADGTKRVNGMGTGIVIDERGYIITNHHVIEGVRRIQVTMGDERTYVARLVARDPNTDLAIIKINAPEPLPLLAIGTSSDLMTGEPVIAVGNAYGYHHTVTRGIISALERTVEVTDSQKYYNLIQTDASINPGNSGGPLLNIDGEMIGINVAVRVGAQGIGFAIPADKAMEVAARLLRTERYRTARTSAGLQGGPRIVGNEWEFVVSKVDSAGAAGLAGIRAGDTIKRIGPVRIRRQLDVERALLGHKTGSTLEVSLQRGNQLDNGIRLVLGGGGSQRVENATANQTHRRRNLDSWEALGVRLSPVSPDLLEDSDGKYAGGLRVGELRENGVAARHGIEEGDILVGVHRWRTVSYDDLDYILNRSPIKSGESVRFYVVRGAITHEGKMPILR